MSGTGILSNLVIGALAAATLGVSLLGPQLGISRWASIVPAVALGGALIVASVAPRLRVWGMARYARDLILEGKHEEALEVLDRLIDRFGSSPDEQTEDMVAYALIARARVYEDLGRTQKALVLYRDAIARFADCDRPRVRDKVQIAISSGVRLLAGAGRSEEAATFLREQTAGLRWTSDKAAQLAVSRALLQESYLLGDAGQWQQAIAAAQRVKRELGSSRDSGLVELAVQAQVQIASAWRKAGEYEKAVAAASKVIRGFGHQEEPAIRTLVSDALLIKGLALGSLGRREAEVVACQEVVDRSSDAIERWACEIVGNAMVALAMALDALGRTDEALAAHGRAAAWLEGRLEMLPEADLYELAMMAHRANGDGLRELDRFDAALAEYDAALARLSAPGKSPDRGDQADLEVRRGAALDGLDRWGEALRAYDRAIRLYEKIADDGGQSGLATAMIDKAFALRETGKHAAALAVCDDIVARFAGSDDAWTRKCVAEAKKVRRSLRARAASKPLGGDG